MPNMKEYKVITHTTLVTTYKVKAQNKEEALEKYGMDCVICGEGHTNEHVVNITITKTEEN